MNKTIKIEGLHCPNCARNLQNELNKIEGVTNVQIDVVKATLYFESDNIDTALSKIAKLTKKIEPDVKLVYETTEKKKVNWAFLSDLLMLVVGIALSGIVCFVNMNPALFWVLFVTAALLLGYKTYYKAIRLLFKGVINENLLLTISVAGAAILGEFMESLMVIALYSIGKIFEGLAVSKSRKSIQKLTNLQPEFSMLNIW